MRMFLYIPGITLDSKEPDTIKIQKKPINKSYLSIKI